MIKMLRWTIVTLTVYPIASAFPAEDVQSVNWILGRDSGLCMLSTVVSGTEFEFSIDPHPIMVIQNDRWRIPPGKYPVQITYLADRNDERSLTVPSHVYPMQPDRIVISWETSADLLALVSVAWLRFSIGPHDFTVPAAASYEAADLSNCAKSDRHRLSSR